ncbi:response regulator transcription factor [Shewanella sp. 10N.261.52.F9]|uniref:helix-turn-helix transcriptional regulator n=1 Tax=Shewanella TaxID=22 RepID=UPI0020105125|nr:response regulator transcription factor [Shewanella marinintestina]MCL1145590.1 response regulator transcription factor [Shewanella marinintestina]
MNKIDEIVFLHQMASPCHLAILADSIGLKTRVVSDVEQLEHNSNKSCFYLVSQQGAALDSNGIPLVATQLVKHVPVALYQVDRDRLNGEAALLSGISGLLFLDERMDLLLTGLKKMLDDELWFDRPLLSKVFKHLVSKVDVSSNLANESSETLEVLTNREKTIIQLVSSGARNKEIATKLSISEHTVKAHISSIFRKTQARNRVELLRWAQSFQSHLDLFALSH